MSDVTLKWDTTLKRSQAYSYSYNHDSILVLVNFDKFLNHHTPIIQLTILEVTIKEVNVFSKCMLLKCEQS